VSATLEPMLETELWVSFVSVLRAYAAAASLHSNAAPQIEVTPDSVALVADASRTDLRFDPLSRIVQSRTRNVHGDLLAAGEFEILPDGTIGIDGAKLEMDHVAIDLIGSVTAHSGRVKGDCA
jgi:hypothetical protein